MTPRRPRRLLRALIPVAGVALIATGIAAGASRHARHRTARHPLAHAAAGSYDVLLRAPTAADAENEAIVGAAREDHALEPAQARLLDATADGRIWLIPTSDGRLCVGVEPGGRYEQLERTRGLEHLSLGYSCSPIEAAETQGIAVRVYDEVVGVVPDGVSSVLASVAGAAPDRLAVVDNTYRVSVPEGFQEGSISFQDRDGAEQVDQL